MSAPPETKNNSPNLTRGIINRVIQVVVGFILISTVLFLSAGRLDWRMGWVYCGLYIFGLIINLIIFLTKNPEIIAARAQGIKEDSKRWDKIGAAVYAPMPFILMAISGLDAGRNGWSVMPAWVQILGIALFLIAWFFSTWSMVSNKFFEGTVRIQKDRGHKTVTSGPYAIIRHPGYAAFILLYFATSLFLGSWWGLIPAGIIAALFVLRTAREDRTLFEELPDYPAYTQQVRYRLLTGVW